MRPIHQALFLLLLLILLASIPAQIRVQCATTVRKTAWVNCFDAGKRQILGTVKLDYGSPIWKQEYAKLSGFRSQRLRLGAGSFATFSTKLSIHAAGKHLAPGEYYLAFECSRAGHWSIAFMDQAEIKARKTPPWRSDRTRGVGTPVDAQGAG